MAHKRMVLMQILVTGGLGFVGKHLIRLLKATYPNCHILCLDKNSHQTSTDVGVETIIGHTMDIVSLMKNYPRPDVIFHLGEFSRIRPSFTKLEDVWNSVCMGTFRVIQYCSENHIKLIYTGSSSKFGDTKNETLSPYVWYKAKNTELIHHYSQWFGLNYRIGYLCNVYGPGQIENSEYATVIGIFEKQYRQKNPLTIISPGTQKRYFTHVEDVCAGLIQLLDYPKNSEFIFGHPEAYSIFEVAHMFRSDYILIPAQPGERFKLFQPNNEAELELGWKPTHSLPEYIAKLPKS